MQSPLDTEFWDQTLVSDGCWLWTGRTSGKGYGKFLARVGHRHEKAGRLMCQSAHHADLTNLEQEIRALRADNAELRDRLAIAQAKAADATGTLTC